MFGSVLITGGSGSLGNALARRLLAVEKPERIIVFSRGEHAQEAMARALKPIDPDGRMRFLLGDVRDVQRLELAMRGVDTVIHAAALKSVPKCEVDPSEAIKTNVLGADNVVHAALRAEVERVVGISSDKGCSPNTLYGSTKLCAERLFTAAGVYAGAYGPKFAACRYGNVSGSQGSVIPLWRQMIAAGRPTVPITDPEATRYWLLMAEAVDLVMWTLREMRGGEVVVPEMPAYRVGDLADAVGARGYTVGLRPAEKLHEAIVNEHEARSFVKIGNYWVANAQPEKPAPILSGALTSDKARRLSVEELKGLLATMDSAKERIAA
ncbi:MAG: SDR family NAD(P)-dependent oxidoreductase [Hyphomicrobiales bacterium]|nr:SDR family NAD(P)-dependent oxidoreductase [Hyphomicrobiales bacterium]